MEEAIRSKGSTRPVIGLSAIAAYRSNIACVGNSTRSIFGYQHAPYTIDEKGGTMS